MADSHISSLLSFSPDALLAVLVRVPSSDHANLRLTCGALRKILRSDEFRRERCLSGWVETRVKIGKNDLLNYDDADAENCLAFIEGRIFVDGQELLGECIEATLIPRPPGQREFHRATVHGEYMKEAAWIMCDAAGVPRHQSVKEAGGAECTSGGFLYLKKFWILDDEYRVNTNVGAAAIRSLLCDTPLAGLWTLAVYELDAMHQFSHEDFEEYRQMRSSDVKRTRWRRVVECRKLDARQFLRAGFQQMPDLLEYACPSIVSAPLAHAMHMVFAVPNVVRGDEMISHEEALDIPIVERPSLPEYPTGVNGELLKLIKDTACSRKYLNNDLARIVSHPTNHGRKRAKGESRSSPDAIRKELEKLNRETKAKAAHFVCELGATVAESFALHCASRMLIPNYIDMLLELVPPYKVRDVMNSLDEDGMTPLMHAASTGSWNRWGEYTTPLNEWFGVCEKLLGLGADLSLVNPISGKTALGCFRSKLRWHNDNLCVDGRSLPQSVSEHVEKMERLLKPIGGETEADKFDLPFLP